MRIAADVASGEFFPLSGPILASNFNLGPVWYYFLAMIQWLGLGYLGTVAIVAALSSLQYPLAYLAGKHWNGCGTGLIWMVLLAVPSWSFYEQVFPGHFSLTATATAALILLSIRFLREGSHWQLALLALTASLAAHAHPTTLLLLPIPLICVVCGWCRHRPSWWIAPIALIIALLPIIPTIVEVTLSGRTLTDAWWSYQGSEQARGSLGQLPILLWQLTGGPVHYWLTVIAGFPTHLGLVLAIMWTLTVGIGICLAVAQATLGNRQLLLLLISFVIALLGLALIRSFFPYYMFTSVRVLMLGVAASGLTSAIGGQIPVKRQIVIGGLALGMYITAMLPAAQHQGRGAWPFGFVPLFSTTGSWDRPVPLAITTARGVSEGGRWLCEHPPVRLHGAWAQMHIISFGIERMIGCGKAPQAIGGAKPEFEGWLGISNSLLDQLGIVPPVNVGSFGLLPVDRIVGPGTTILVPEMLSDPPNSPLPAAYGKPEAWQTDVPLADDDLLVASDLGFGFTTPPDLRVQCGGIDLIPIAADAVTRLYTSNRCTEPLRVKLRSPAPELVDLVIIRIP